MKTRIVATIGNRDSYRQGIIDLDGAKISPEKIDVDRLVSEFCRLGADIIRLNLAHVDIQRIGEVFSNIKRAILGWEQKNADKRIAVLADLPGPKIRFHLERKVRFRRGAEFTVHFEQRVSADDGAAVYVDDKPLKTAMKGSFEILIKQIKESREKIRVLVGDGEVVMEVISVDGGGTSMCCRVVTVKNPEMVGNKGFTLKGVDVTIPSFTETDRQKLDRLLETEYQGELAGDPVLAFIGLSFTQSEDDVLRLKEHIEKKLNRISGQTPSIIAKIETALGWQNIDAILDVADGIMVARGDLGLQMEIEEVPALQKKLIRLSNKRGKPVITATEMLKSMTESAEPTRAESTDVFNAILDGSDAVMTSEETACGRYPFHAIRKMESIAVQAEHYFEMKDLSEDLRRSANLLRYQEFLQDDYARIQENNRRLRQMVSHLGERMGSGEGNKESLTWRRSLYAEKLERSRRQPTTNRLTQAACTMAESTEIKGIIAATSSGRTVRMISRLRPSVIVVGASHDIIVTRKLTISYGVIPLYIGDLPENAGTDELFNRCREVIKQGRYLQQQLKEGDMIIFTAGTPLGKPGTTNLIQMKHL